MTINIRLKTLERIEDSRIPILGILLWNSRNSRRNFLMMMIEDLTLECWTNLGMGLGQHLGHFLVHKFKCQRQSSASEQQDKK